MEKTKTMLLAPAMEFSDVYFRKNGKYGDSWLEYRAHSLLDLIYAKAVRMRVVEEKGANSVEDEPLSETACSLSNYTYMLWRKCGNESPVDAYYRQCIELAELKDSDYGGAWRGMDRRSFTDFCLVKIKRCRKMLSEGDLEGVANECMDISNYMLMYIALGAD